ncbi:MAG: type 3 dihydrofolate reductase [Halothiobacillaceae bacterium]
MHISLISALTEDNVIGDGNRLPWHLPADLKRFKALTMGKPIVMGRRTYESIGRLLPGRRTIIISRNSDFRVEGAEVVHGLDEALDAADGAPEVMICGGADIYFQFLPRADRMYLTLVHASIAGDAHFPAFSRQEWETVEETHHAADADNPHAYSFLTLERR